MVKSLRSDYEEQMKATFGDTILDQVNAFYANYEENPDTEPSDLVRQALDFKASAIAHNQLLTTYYGGIDAIGKYYESLMYQDVREKLGDDFWPLQDMYFKLPEGSARREFLTANPTLKQYWDLKSEWETRIDAALLSFGGKLPEAKSVEIRPDAPAEKSMFQEQFIEAQQPQQIDAQQVMSQLGQESSNLVMDFVRSGQALPYAVRNKLEKLAEEMGVSYYELLYALEGQLQQ
jgi:hypothetical protein